MKHYHNCPNCESQDKQLVATEYFKGNKFEIGQCTKCQLLFTTFQEIDTNESYKTEIDERFYKKYNDFLKNDLNHDRRLNYQEEVKLIKKFQDKGKLLDIGCNAGWLLGYLKREVPQLELHGIEPSKFLADVANQRTGAKITNSYYSKEIFPKNFFNFITMTDVFEHVPNPHEILSAISYHLDQSGHVMIKVPNGRFTYFKYRFKNILKNLIHPSDIFDAKEHLVHYDKKNLISMLNKHGLEPILIKAPLPIQTMGSKMKTVFLRSLLHHLSKLGIPGQDILVIARKRI